MQRVRSNAIEYNSVALALPIYRALVSSTTSILIPHLFQYIKDEESRTGRPGANRIAIPYITAVGVEKCTAIAVITTINNFHRSLSYQSLSLKIGQYIAAEWSILQEDPEIVGRIQANTYKGASTIRRQIFLDNNCLVSWADHFSLSHKWEEFPLVISFSLLLSVRHSSL